MNPKAEKLFDAITLLPEELIEEAQDCRFQARGAAWRRFGALAACLFLIVSIGMVAVMPKGCGGGAPAPGANSSGAPVSGEAAPSDGGVSTDTATPQEPEASPSHQFTAKVVEVRDTGTRPVIVVEPLEGEPERASADRIVVTAAGEVPVLEVGDLVRITYDGQIQETYPAGISGAQQIEKLEENG